MEQCVKGEENSLGFYVANADEMLIRGVCAAKTIETQLIKLNLKEEELRK